jgi:hypothetical protein
MFNPKVQPVEASKVLMTDPELAGKIIAVGESLLKEKTSIELP